MQKALWIFDEGIFFCVSFKYCENCDIKEATQKINQIILVGALYRTWSLYAKNNEIYFDMQGLNEVEFLRLRGCQTLYGLLSALVLKP